MFKVTLAKPYEAKRVVWPAVVMPKLDGVRAVFKRLEGEDGLVDDGQYHFVSRDGKVWNDNVVAHILEPMRKMIPAEFNIILDGEFYRHGWPLQKINGAIAVRRKEPSADTSQIGYTIFDMFDASQGFLNRIERAKNAVRWIEHKQITAIHYEIVDSEAEVAEFQVRQTKLGYEGTMIRNQDAPYEQKRTFNLMKFKDWMDDEFKCINVVEGRDAEHSIGGRLHGTLGALELLTHDGKSFQCGSGFDDATRHAIWGDPSMVIGRKVTIKFFRYTEDGIPYAPIFVTVRDYE